MLDVRQEAVLSHLMSQADESAKTLINRIRESAKEEGEGLNPVVSALAEQALAAMFRMTALARHANVHPDEVRNLLVNLYITSTANYLTNRFAGNASIDDVIAHAQETVNDFAIFVAQSVHKNFDPSQADPSDKPH